MKINTYFLALLFLGLVIESSCRRCEGTYFRTNLPEDIVHLNFNGDYVNLEGIITRDFDAEFPIFHADLKDGKFTLNLANITEDLPTNIDDNEDNYIKWVSADGKTYDSRSIGGNLTMYLETYDYQDFLGCCDCYFDYKMTFSGVLVNQDDQSTVELSDGIIEMYR